MSYYNSDRSHQAEKTRDIKERSKKGAVKGRSHLDTKRIQKESNAKRIRGK